MHAKTIQITNLTQVSTIHVKMVICRQFNGFHLLNHKIFFEKLDIAVYMREKKTLRIIPQVLIHLLFWIGVYFFYNYFLGYGTKNTTYINRFSLFLLPVTICVSYFFLYFLIPKFLFKKKQGLFILYTIYTFIISSFFITLSVLYGLVFLLGLTTNNISPLTKTLPFIVLGVYFIILIVIMLGMVMHNYKSTLKNEDLKNKFLQTQLQLKEQELKFLKTQIHPHFLFNTLNTLYGFALKKSDSAPDMILKLSNLLDYILYQVDKPSVLLTNEIQHIDNYIVLEKMRFQDSLDILFTKELNQKKIEIPPMLLLPFVENAFKHGIQIDGVLKIKATLTTTSNFIEFNIQNTSKKTSNSKKGIGLENIKKRLKMLFKRHYSLKITQQNNNFEVNLKIPLNHV